MNNGIIRTIELNTEWQKLIEADWKFNRKIQPSRVFESPRFYARQRLAIERAKRNVRGSKYARNL